MNIVAIGSKLERYLFVLIKVANELRYGFRFFKQYMPQEIAIADIIVMDSKWAELLPKDINNMIISVKTTPDYVSQFKREAVINIASLSQIPRLIVANDFIPIIADDCTKKVFEIAKKVSHGDAPILITGSSGTGKSFLARFIHMYGQRSNHPYCIIDCADRRNLDDCFHNILANSTGGSALIKHIHLLNIDEQTKLSQIIDINAKLPIERKTRFISTTCVPLYENVLNNTFLSQLFFKLNAVPIILKDLSDRPRDIKALAEFFCKHFSHGSNTLSQKQIDELIQMSWNDNIRELQHFIKHEFSDLQSISV